MSASMIWEGRLGVPYQGSKNQIAKEIIGILPRGKRFVDLFAGGCAMTHAAMISGRYDTFLANDLHGFGLRLFISAIKGECNGRWKEWVSREEFFEKKDTDPLISLCWSFSNNGRSYLYGKEIEEMKRATFDKFLETGKLDSRVEGYEKVQSLRQVESLERIQALERLQALERTYAEFDTYADGDVVYCDPPYANTGGYNTQPFDSATFWEWAYSRPYPVFVSEYHAPSNFVPIWAKCKRQLMAGNGSGGIVQERLFVADRYADQFQTDLFNCEN